MYGIFESSDGEFYACTKGAGHLGFFWAETILDKSWIGFFEYFQKVLKLFLSIFVRNHLLDSFYIPRSLR